jgi:hypothetical protein
MQKESWKDYIPKEEHYLFDESIEPKTYLSDISSKETVNSPHEDLVLKLNSYDRDHINHLVGLGRILDLNKIDGSKKVMLAFAMDNVPFSFKGSNKDYARIISNFYAENMANYLSEDFSLKEAHNSAIVDTYIKMFELKK